MDVNRNHRRLSAVATLILCAAASAADPNFNSSIAVGAPQTVSDEIPHWRMLQQRFEDMLVRESPVRRDASTPFAKIDDLKQLLSKEKISDRELAFAVLKFLSQQEKAMGESLLTVGFSAIMSATKPLELAKVWTKSLDSADEKVRSSAGMLLGQLELFQNDRPNFRLYTSILAENPEALQTSLVEYMFVQDGSQAFLSLVSATRDSRAEKRQQSHQRELDLLFAHHMIEHAGWLLNNQFKEGRTESVKTATEQIAKLADAPEWWARLYAAQALVHHQELRVEATVKKLADDKHPMVSKTIQTIAPSRASPTENR